MDDLTCHRCQYSLRTLSQSAACPECGTPVIDSIRTKEERKIVRTDAKILSRKDYYRRNRTGAACLAILGGFSLMAASLIPIASSASTTVVSGMTYSGFFNVVLWGLIAYVNHACLRHARSIEFHHREPPRRPVETQCS